MNPDKRTNSKASFLSIIIPVFNEEENVAILFSEIEKAVTQIQYRCEIIFIDDGSSDNTFETLKELKHQQQKDSPIDLKIIRFSRNFGQTATIQAGFDRAQGEIIVCMDGDLQNDPADIPKLLAKVDEGYDVVSGWRKRRQDNWLTRVLPSKVANYLIAIITGVPIHDNGCSLKAYRSSVIRSVQLYSDMHRFIPAMTTIVGAMVGEVVVNHRPRLFGQSKYGLSRAWKVMFDLITVKMLIRFYSRPILWFAAFGMIFLLLGVTLGLTSTFLFLEGNPSLVLSTSSILFLFLFGNLLSWGLLAEFFMKVRTITFKTQSK